MHRVLAHEVVRFGKQQLFVGRIHVLNRLTNQAAQAQVRGHVGRDGFAKQALGSRLDLNAQ